MTTKRREIVIVGAGFGGVRAALLIARGLKRYALSEHYRVRLLDPHPFHTYTPTLYEVATTSQQTASLQGLRGVVTIPLKDIFAGLPIEILADRATGVLSERSLLITERTGQIAYDHLVLAPGAAVADFGIPGILEFGFPLKSFADAVRLREKITMLAADFKGHEFRVIIGGAGSTGVELAGELSQWLCHGGQMLPKACKGRIMLLDGAPTVLPGFLPSVIARAKQRLDKLGVQTLLGDFISRVQADAVILKNGTVLPYDLFVWTGGIRQPDLMESVPAERDERRAVLVDAQLQVRDPDADPRLRSRIYAIGDAVRFVDQCSGKVSPATATVALAQATVVAKNILEEIAFVEHKKTKPAFLSYRPKKSPYIIPIGGKFAIASVGSVVLSGLLGWLLKLLVEFKYLISIMPFGKAMQCWIKGVRVYIQND